MEQIWKLRDIYLAVQIAVLVNHPTLGLLTILPYAVERRYNSVYMTFLYQLWGSFDDACQE